MKNLNYCVDCKRISNFVEKCSYCQSENIKELTRKAPVNVIGTKIKGNAMSVKDNMIEVLCRDAGNVKTLRKYEVEKLKKIL